MFIDNDINKENIHLHLNQNVTSHYEIEDFRDHKSVDIYLQELIAHFVEIEAEEKENNCTLESVMEELLSFEEMYNDTLESLLLELSEI